MGIAHWKRRLNFLLAAGAFGLVIANNASISGAEGGCQAEVGSASAMSAAALVLAAGGSPFQASQAICFVIKNMLGLICDPVAGLVEVPCVKRNAIGASYAFIAADIYFGYDLNKIFDIISIIKPIKGIHADTNVNSLGLYGEFSLDIQCI